MYNLTFDENHNEDHHPANHRFMHDGRTDGGDGIWFFTIMGCLALLLEGPGT